ncbi:PPOX class F420-dependent oxidoreductase [Allobranchiibius sp. CTAmp26]|uniref:PPOX class F420-dependent oxidoreductase n=1 Tax=Allobranchiibius sp. CTAmp26 TaxID=2815214 RepID=UPI001AA14997|nr:PPOX class F420-dependent oxidoreductase [Allobranchiibius sp. CTAmp26]MBO1756818.1 PPOX class F420-dependent oxidoreductase [Allobranchiibius sp. CTAmp26]
MDLPTPLLELLSAPSPCFVTTLMSDGGPQITQTWVDTDGEHVLINTVVGFQKVRNVERDPRVAVAVIDPQEPRRYFEVRGRVIAMSTDGAADQIEALSQRYTGRSYASYGGADQERITLTIEADSINTIG